MSSHDLLQREWRCIAYNACRELAWIHRLIGDFQVIAPTPVQLRCVNVTTMHITCNPFFHERTKQVKTDCHLIMQYFSSDFIILLFVPSLNQVADVLTKALASEHLACLCSKLSVLNVLHTMSLRVELKLVVNLSRFLNDLLCIHP